MQGDIGELDDRVAGQERTLLLVIIALSQVMQEVWENIERTQKDLAAVEEELASASDRSIAERLEGLEGAVNEMGRIGTEALERLDSFEARLKKLEERGRGAGGGRGASM